MIVLMNDDDPVIRHHNEISMFNIITQLSSLLPFIPNDFTSAVAYHFALQDVSEDAFPAIGTNSDKVNTG